MTVMLLVVMLSVGSGSVMGEADGGDGYEGRKNK